jgi:hypothetical protein
LANEADVTDALFIARLDEDERKAVQNGFRYIV